jgi:hypothetical protein
LRVKSGELRDGGNPPLTKGVATYMVDGGFIVFNKSSVNFVDSFFDKEACFALRS